MSSTQGFDSTIMPLAEENVAMLASGSGYGPSWSTESQKSSTNDEWSNSYLSMEGVDEIVDEIDDDIDDEINNEIDDDNFDENTAPTLPHGEPEEHQSPASAYHHLASKTLLAVTAYGDLPLVPAATCARAYHKKNDPILSDLCGIGVQTQKDVKNARVFLEDTQSGTPRFLFRGFHAQSGGGVDPRLNGPHGVIPHAYLNGSALTSVWKIDDIFGMTTDHIQNADDIESPFSSWTHTLTTALGFALDNNSSTIAVLDTASMVDRVWHTDDLYAAGLADAAYDDEFLVHGPVSGPGYHCISVQDLVDTTRIGDINNGPSSAFGHERISLVERGAVESSRHIAVALQPPGASLENIVTLTARFVGVRMSKFLGRLEYLSYPDMHGFLYYARDGLQGLAMGADARDISLANQTMDTFHSQALVFEVQMLQAAENAVHILARDLRAAN